MLRGVPATVRQHFRHEDQPNHAPKNSPRKPTRSTKNSSPGTRVFPDAQPDRPRQQSGNTSPIRRSFKKCVLLDALCRFGPGNTFPATVSRQYSGNNWTHNQPAKNSICNPNQTFIHSTMLSGRKRVREMTFSLADWRRSRGPNMTFSWGKHATSLGGFRTP